MANKAYLTAISRKKLSGPMQWLMNNRLIPMCQEGKRKLDYGCGRGTDAEQLDMMKYDPHYFPDTPLTPGFYYCVTCNYVLNVIPEKEERGKVLSALKELGSNRVGSVYVSVRNDKRSLNGWTTRDTWQGLIEDSELAEAGFEKIYTNSNFRMFRWSITT
jgi:hypothetical protein